MSRWRSFVRWYEDHAKPKCLNDFWRWCKSTVENLVDGCSIYPGHFSECNLTAYPPNFGTEQLNHLFRLKWSQASAWLADGGPPILSFDNNPEHARWSLAMKNAARQCTAMDFQQHTGRAAKNRPSGRRGPEGQSALCGGLAASHTPQTSVAPGGTAMPIAGPRSPPGSTPRRATGGGRSEIAKRD